MINLLDFPYNIVGMMDEEANEPLYPFITPKKEVMKEPEAESSKESVAIPDANFLG